MSAFVTLVYEKQEAVAHISLNRPAALNAFNVQMRDDLSEALTAVAGDPEVHAVLITGQGRAFCAGADLTEFGRAPSPVIARQVRWQRDLWGQILALEIPVVTAVHGYCFGSGLEIALLGDLCLAAQGTVFAMPEVQLGMVPAAGGTQTLSRRAGPSAALDLLLTGRRFDAAEALRLRLVTRVLPADRLTDAAWEVAQQLAGLGRPQVTAAKRALTEGADLSLGQALHLESRLAAVLGMEAPVTQETQ
ncbi:MAG: enoyl-CoA hydratase/isomerase family protein [Dehalococcoidia bacterium]|nr:enoyl-CoA hydratase/isomerase family protein [Dehalococcoidia bacterium]MSQ16313.1 enoyl-CoA hydratase/isomerase family protein [Dehalococcoidia bacterium]